MFTVDQFIDTVQNGKKQVLKAVVTNDAYLKPLENFVDAQTAYTRSAFKATQDSLTELATAFTLDKTVQQLYANTFTDWTKYNWMKPSSK